MKKKIKIDPFNFGWWIVIIGIFVLSASIIFALKGHDREQCILFMKGYSLFLCAYFVGYKYSLSLDKTWDFNFWNELPFQLCNITTIILPLSLFLDHPILQCFCFVIAFFGPMMAIAMPDLGFFDIPLISIRSIGYYGYHALLVVSSICLVGLGIYEPSYQHIPYLIGLLFILVIIVHGINYLFRAIKLHPKCNFMYTYGLDNNPVLKMMKEKIPYNLIYELPLLPVAGLVAALMIFVVNLFK